ncbi:TRAP transporter substrate-binding protein DctP [Gemmobacter sp.]|uniref:TRAP transporter substrate-binding protein DctP n=1 Tax=Gemmobacter sp. TaxID=1898957 RepID=UPI002AFDE86E|nr:TRAP transporter substrate-binding protein DctP [Gemmobacter sp.]
MNMLTKTLFGATFAGCMTVLPAMADTANLKFGTGIPSAGDQWKDYHADWAARVEKSAGDALKLELYPDSALGKNGQMFDRVDAGVADIAWDLPLVYGNRFAGLTVVGLPNFFRDNVAACGAIWKMYEAGMFPALDDYKVIAFTCNPNVNIITKTPLKDITDLSGLKIGLGSKLRGEIVKRMGGVPVSVIVPEYYQSLSRGVIDGVMTNIAVMQAWKLDEEVKYIVDAPFGLAVGAVFMKKSTYDALSDAAKKAIDDNAGYDETIRASENVTAAEKRFTDQVTAAGVSVASATDAQIERLREMTAGLEKEWVDATPNGAALRQAFIDAYNKEVSSR